MLKRWTQPNGYKAVLKVSLPLVASMGSTTVMLFTDRMFLGRYSIDAIAAVTPAGLTAFSLTCFFLGVVGYTNTFIAQYTGAGTPEGVAVSLWQGLYFALGAGLILAAMSFLAEPIFALAGHDPEVQKLEVVYFKIVMSGAVLSVLHETLACFYSGRGLTKTIMLVSLTGPAVNVPLDYGLINGLWGLPEMGVAGAAYSTLAGHLLITLLFIILILRSEDNRRFHLLQKWKFNPDLFKRLLKYGIPSGISFFIDISAFTFFLFIVGRIGKTELAATNIAFAINTLGFLPMIGFGIGTSTLVGHAIGRGNPQAGVEATTSALHICFLYMFFIALLYLLLPEWLFSWFKPGNMQEHNFTLIQQTGKVLLSYIALYSLFDTGNIIFSAAIKGAGDTRFVTITIAVMSTTLFMVPVYISVRFLNHGLYTAWIFTCIYIISLSFIFLWRFRQGKWKKMSVLETESLTPLK